MKNLLKILLFKLKVGFFLFKLGGKFLLVDFTAISKNTRVRDSSGNPFVRHEQKIAT